MIFFEKCKLIYRANKYRRKDDKGGIKYILQSLSAGNVAFDIGAHKGGYIYFMQRKVGSKGKVFAFEPQSVLYNYLVRMKKIFNWSNVELERFALSNHAGETTLYIPVNKNRPSSPGATIVEHPERNDFRKESVQTEILDVYCNSHSIKPDFLKIDVEGNEGNVFQGATETIKKYKSKILIECEVRHIGKEKVLQTFQLLKNLGYKGFFIRETEFIPLNEFNFSRHQNPDMKPYCNNFIFECD